MIDTRKLKELVRLMVENELPELDLRDQEEKVTIRRGSYGAPVAQAAYPGAHAAPPPMHAHAASPGENGQGGDEDDAGLLAVESPMVGTFYARANPDSEPFA